MVMDMAKVNKYIPAVDPTWAKYHPLGSSSASHLANQDSFPERENVMSNRI